VRTFFSILVVTADAKPSIWVLFSRSGCLRLREWNTDVRQGTIMDKIRHSKFYDLFLNTLSKKMVMGFILIIAMGTFMLSLPVATYGNPVSFINALFTATSATCITGLTVVNTADTWTPFGQVAIMVMTEIGALGYMTFAVLLFNVMRRHLNLSTQLMVKESLILEHLHDTKNVMQYVIVLSALFQIAGMILFAFDFIARYWWSR